MMQHSEVTASRSGETAQDTKAQAPASEDKKQTEQPSASGGDDNLVVFACMGGKTISAVFTRDIVGITLSDGRQMELRQDVSGSGIRYVSNDGSVEFRGQGEEGFLEENGTTTYSNCHSSRL